LNLSKTNALMAFAVVGATLRILLFAFTGVVVWHLALAVGKL
jgi:hypothetical protein